MYYNVLSIIAKNKFPLHKTYCLSSPAVKEHHRLSSLLKNSSCFSRFWRLRNQDQGSCRFGIW